MGADLDLQPLPKAELHQHLDGAMRVETAVALAALAGMSLTADQARRRMVAPDRCASQAALLRYFELPISLLQTERALRRVAAELVADLVADGVRYAELRWAPRLHLEGGLSVAEVIAAVAVGIAEAAAEIGPRTPLVGLIVTAMRSHPPAANVQLAHDAVAFGPPVVGFDLAGDEAGFPAPPHAAAFVVAREGGLGLSVHAGEVPGVEHIVEALDLGARRIAHGVTAIDDPSLMQRLRDLDVTLDLCPTSNVQSGVVSGLAAHPAARLHRAGLSITLSTDDRTVSGTTLSAELARTAAALRLSRAELAQIALNGFRRGFAPSGMRAPLIGEAERAWSSWAARTARPTHPTRAARAG